MSAEVGVDLAAETLALAFERRHRFRGRTRQAEEAWIMAIAKTQLHNYWRHGEVERRALERLKVERPALAPDDIIEVERRADLPWLRQRLAESLDGLPAPQREAVTMRIIDEVTYSHAAERLDVSEQVVRARVSRGLRALATSLEDLRPEEIT